MDEGVDRVSDSDGAEKGTIYHGGEHTGLGKGRKKALILICLSDADKSARWLLGFEGIREGSSLT